MSLHKYLQSCNSILSRYFMILVNDIEIKNVSLYEEIELSGII